MRHAITDLAVSRDPDGPDGPVLARPAERLGLLFNEIAGNALRHGGPVVQAELQRIDDGWLLQVHDDGDSAPELRHQDPLAPGGHGLHLVLALSDRCGWYTRAGATVVWADVRDRAPDHLSARLTGRTGATSGGASRRPC